MDFRLITLITKLTIDYLYNVTVNLQEPVTKTISQLLSAYCLFCNVAYVYLRTRSVFTFAFDVTEMSLVFVETEKLVR